VSLAAKGESSCKQFGCDHLDLIIREIQKSTDPEILRDWDRLSPERQQAIVDEVAKRNALNSVRWIYHESLPLRRMADEGKIAIVGSLYHIEQGRIDFMTEEAIGAPLEGALA
jgi:carbonic anhydrase/SulP family sulfate permease